ncbi:MAG: DNA polymerase III subunit epsilon, partial [Pseudomonadota bacterium]
EILAEVYLELIGGRQPDFGLSTAANTGTHASADTAWTPPLRPHPLPPRLKDQERDAHADFVKKLGESALW